MEGEIKESEAVVGAETCDLVGGGRERSEAVHRAELGFSSSYVLLIRYIVYTKRYGCSKGTNL